MAQEGQVHELAGVALAGVAFLLFEDLLGHFVAGVYHHIHRVGEAAEVHAATAEGAHFLHAAHEFGAHQHHGHFFLAQGLGAYAHVLWTARHHGLIYFHQFLFLVLGQGGDFGFVLLNQLVGAVGVHALDGGFLMLLLHPAHEMAVDHGIEHQHVVAFALGGADIAVLRLFVGGIEPYHVLVLVGLQWGDLVAVFVEFIEFALGILDEGEVVGALGEFLVGEDAVLHEGFDIAPFGFVAFLIVKIDFLELVGHLFGDIGADLLHIAIGLEEAAAHVQGDIGAVDHALEEHEVVGHDFLHAVGDEYLAAVELDAVLADLEVVFDFGEEQDAGELEGVVHIEVDPEQGLFLEGVEVVIELLIVLVGEFVGGFGPDGVGLVHHFAFKFHFHGEEFAVFGEDMLDARGFEEFLGVLGDVQDDVGATVRAITCAEGIGSAAVAGPVHCGGFLLPGLGLDLHGGGHHECGVETETELADDFLGILHRLEFLHEFLGTGKGHLVDVFLHFVGAHPDTAIADGKGSGLCVEGDGHFQVAQFLVIGSDAGEVLDLACGIHGIGYEFAEEDLVVGIEGFLDDGEDVLGMDGNIAGFRLGHWVNYFCHILNSFKRLMIVNARKDGQKSY